MPESLGILCTYFSRTWSRILFIYEWENSKDWTLERRTAAIWKVIGQETVNAVKDILATFVLSLGNLAEDSIYFMAEGWAFWFMYLAPILLQGRFSNNKYYKHLCQLSDIMKTCIKFSLSHTEINNLEISIADWVK